MGDNMSDIINNFKNMMSNTNSTTSVNSGSSHNSTNSSSNHSPDFNITPEMVSTLMSSFRTSSDSQSQDKENVEYTNNIDFDTIMKIKTIIETLNKKEDANSNLLYSLKPYLRESRQKKIDQYANLLKISQVANLFRNEKGDES